MASVLIDGPERVARGAALLDKVKPCWPQIVVEANGDLDIKDCAKCVLGRCFGSFSRGIHRLEQKANTMIGTARHGFNVSVYEMNAPDRGNAAYDELRDLWLAEARRRLDNPA